MTLLLGSLTLWLLDFERHRTTEFDQPAWRNFWRENQEPICAGIIAGAALTGVLDALVTTFLLGKS